jgi:microcystin-dependent protein
MDPFIGQIQPFAFNFAPRGWAKCDGTLLSIAQYQALFSLIGATYGGDGRTTFALPDLRGRVALHQGTGPGLSNRQIGQHSGSETTTLNVTNMPSHNHMATGTVKASFTPPAGGGSLNNPSGSNFSGSTGTNVYSNQAPNVTMAAENVEVVVGNNGGNLPFNNMEPYLVVNWCIALDGIFPPRS